MNNLDNNLDRKLARTYVAQDFDPTDAKALAAAYGELERRSLDSPQALEQWIRDWEELGAVVYDRYSRVHVATTVDTTDAASEKQLMHLLENIVPLTETHGFKLNRKLLGSPHASKLSPFYSCFLRVARADADLYREENVPLLVQERKLVNEYEKIMGGLTAVFRGEELTLQQLMRFLESPDRKTREEAFRTRAQTRLKIAPELDALFDRMLAVRRKIAVNAGLASYREYMFAAMHRFDYAPKDCFEFHDAIAADIVPLVSRLHAERVGKLKIESLRPWDTQVDPNASTPAQPFENIEQLIQRCRLIFNQVDAEIGRYFEHMISHQLLDLGSRKGKAPGGYCTHFSESRTPFIFMNAAGTRRDVETLLHEGGHAFHYYLARELPLHSYHVPGMEFAEVASMAMELLSRPFFGEFYARDQVDSVRSDQLKKILEFFPFMAMIDAFQHWVYTAEDASAPARKKKWAELEKRFQPKLDWGGLEDVRDLGWQYPHVFTVPFYYIEYGIAQLGALTIWRESLGDHARAVQLYKKGLALGGSKPLPELFSTVGGRFGLSSQVIRPLVQAIEKNLAP